jgi:ribosome biogenesis ATPase
MGCFAAQLDDAVDLGAVARDRRCEGFSGADLAGLGREAAMLALKEAFKPRGAAPAPATASVRPAVLQRHFEESFASVFPSVSKRDSRLYASLRHKLGASAWTSASPRAR